MADFKKENYDPKNPDGKVEMIAVVRPNSAAYKKDAEGKPTGEPVAHYVDVMTNNSNLKKSEIQAGEGQAHPNLMNQKTEYTDKNTGEKKTGYSHSIRLSPSQLETIENAGGSKSLEKDGVKYIPFKANVMPVTEKVKDKDGNVVKTDDGKDKTRMVGAMPNTKTVEPSDLGNLTQNRLDKHFANTKAINEVQKAQAETNKNAQLSATAKETAAKETQSEVQSEMS